MGILGLIFVCMDEKLGHDEYDDDDDDDGNDNHDDGYDDKNEFIDY